MSIVESIILGAIQGLTEFIPVSSSGHLVLAQNVLGLPVSHTFEGLINLGTFLALVIYFRSKLWEILLRIFKKGDTRLARNVVITALPVGVVGLVLGDIFAHPWIQNPWVVSFMLVAVGVVMIILDKLPMASGLEDADSLTPKRSGFIGLAQVMALIPGTSRSAITMVAGKIAGLNYRQAAEYSFLVSIPVMAGVVLHGFLGSEERFYIAANFAVWVASNLTAFVFGWLAVGFMLKFLDKGNFKLFGWYRIGLAVVVVTTMLFNGSL